MHANGHGDGSTACSTLDTAKAIRSAYIGVRDSTIKFVVKHCQICNPPRARVKADAPENVESAQNQRQDSANTHDSMSELDAELARLMLNRPRKLTPGPPRCIIC